MVRAITDKVKYAAIEQNLVSMASVGDIQLYDNKATIKYPYVNVDIVSCNKIASLKNYIIRIYVCDRNEPYIAYNKTELILDKLLESIDIYDYETLYFNLDFKDIVNGVYADVLFEVPYGCNAEDIFDYETLKDLETDFTVLENGDIIIKD